MEHDDAERDIRLAWEASDYGRAATRALEAYGDELVSFLIARLRSESDGREAFSVFAEDLWVGLPGFAWRSTMRTWAYTLARNAASRYARHPGQRPARNLTLSQHAELSVLVERVRTRTQMHQRTEAKNKMRALRERLEADDQMLLVLRVDRNLSWRDLAQVMLGDDEASDEDLDREAARLRKRFERVKTELKRMVQAEGLLEET